TGAEGSVTAANAGGHAFRWTAGTGMVGLGAGMARGVSADGSTIVGSNGLGAFRWTANSGMTSLGFLPDDNTSWADGVSGDGSVVFGRASIGDGDVAFLWTHDSGM